MFSFFNYICTLIVLFLALCVWVGYREKNPSILTDEDKKSFLGAVARCLELMLIGFTKIAYLVQTIMLKSKK